MTLRPQLCEAIRSLPDHPQHNHAVLVLLMSMAGRRTYRLHRARLARALGALDILYSTYELIGWNIKQAASSNKLLD